MEISYFLSKIARKIFNRAAIKNSSIDSTARIDVGSLVVGSRLGRYSYIGEHTTVINTDIGNFVSISNFCAIGGGSHPIDWVSTSPVFNSSKGILKKRFSKNKYSPFQKTFIGNDVWIGAHCLIRAGVRIEDGAVIGMGSVVTKNVGRYEIWAGNPAKLIRKRFDDKIIESLVRIGWWNFSDADIQKYADYFISPQKLIQEFSEE